MDLVKGVPITRYCDEHHLTPRQRLELFIPVCQAVQHAHQKGIIHRDLKPSNVLVALYDGKPVPKVIDFGVAKAAGQELTDKTLVTGFGTIVGTLEYMSPEQAEINQLDIDTRSDIYSLGVLLYELLAGSPPFSRKELEKAGLLEMLRVIREQEPPKPSTKLSTADRFADPGRQPRHGAGEADEAGPRRAGLDRDEGAGEGPQPALRDGQRLCDGRAALPGGRAGGGVSAVGVVPVPQVRPAEQAGVADRVGGSPRGGADGGGSVACSSGGPTRTCSRPRRERHPGASGATPTSADCPGGAGMGRQQPRPDGTTARACPADLRGWEWHYLKRLRYGTLPPLRHESPVYSVAFSPDGQYLATATKDGFVRIWQAKTGQELRKWRAHAETATCVAFSPDGRYLASGGWDRTVKVWDVEKVLQGEVPAPLLRLEHTDRVRVWSVTFSPDGQRLASAGGREADEKGEVKVWDMNTGQEALTLSSFTREVRCVRFSPDGRRLATARPGMVQVWDAQTGREQLTWRDPQGSFERLAFSPDGRRIAAVGGLLAVHPDREVKVWDAHTGQEILSLPGHVAGLRSVAFSPDGRRLASAGLDQTIKLWDAATGQEVLTLRGHIDNVFCVAFSPDGHQLASASVDKTVRIWDATPVEREPGPEYLTLRGHAGAVTDVAFHPTDGRSLVSAGTDGTVRVWDLWSGKPLGTLPGPPSPMRLRVAYSPDGRRLAVVSGDRKDVRVWDVATAKEICSFRGHTAPTVSAWRSAPTAGTSPRRA